MMIKQLETPEEAILSNKNKGELKNRAFNTIAELARNSVGSFMPFTCSFDSNRDGFTVTLRTPTAPIAGLGGITGNYSCWYSFDTDVPCDGVSVRMAANTKQLTIVVKNTLYDGEMGIMARELYWNKRSPYSLSFANGDSFEIDNRQGSECRIIKAYNRDEWNVLSGTITPLDTLDEAIQSMMYHFRVFVAAVSFSKELQNLSGTEDTFMKLIEAKLTDQFAYGDWRIPSEKYAAHAKSVTDNERRIHDDCIKRGVTPPPAYRQKYLNSYTLPLYSYEDI